MIVNLYGGPGCRKSTIAAGVFNHFKKLNKQIELVTEYAKDLVYEESHKKLQDQFFISASQYHRIWRVDKYYKDKGLKEDEYVIITDSPFLLGCVYTDDLFLKEYLFHKHDKFMTIDILIRRSCQFNPLGRLQCEEEAIKLDTIIRNDILGRLSDYYVCDNENEVIELLENFIGE